MNIKYSTWLASLIAVKNWGPKCTYFNVDVLIESQNGLHFKEILFLTETTNKDGSTKLHYTPYKVKAKDYLTLTGLPTGRYVDFNGKRYIEIDAIPDDRILSTKIVSRSYAIEHYHIANFDSTYDTTKYIQLDKYPERVWVWIKQLNIKPWENELIDDTTGTETQPQIKPQTTNKAGALLLGAALLLTIND